MKCKFAVVEGERREAKPGLTGKCRFCGNAMIAKCGHLRVWHWSHWVTGKCDPWSEPETEWHRDWKNQFPDIWQEVIHHSKDGEKHVADIKTERGVVLEFQHSFLRREERESRENFYPNLVWIIDGRRLKRDRAQFFASLDTGVIINRQPRIVSVRWKAGALLRDWGASRVPVYFDFGDSEPGDTLRFDTPTLWRHNPCGPNGIAYLTPVTKSGFVRVYLEGVRFEEMCSKFIERAAAGAFTQQSLGSRPLIGFEQHMAKKQRARALPRF